MPKHNPNFVSLVEQDQKSRELILAYVDVYKKERNAKEEFVSIDNRQQGKEIEIHCQRNNNNSPLEYLYWISLHGKSYRLYLNSLKFIAQQIDAFIEANEELYNNDIEINDQLINYFIKKFDDKFQVVIDDLIYRQDAIKKSDDKK